MKPVLLTVIAASAVFPAFLTAQSAKPEFEVASIRKVEQADAGVQVGMHVDGAQVHFNFLTLKEAIRIGWNTKLYLVSGPDWTNSDRYSISAKLPGPAPAEQVQAMLKNLLIERFKLTTHTEKKEFAVYALVPGKNGLKMKESPKEAGDSTPAAPGLNITGSGSGNGVYIDMGGGSYYSFANNKLEARKVTMTRFVDILARFFEKPIVDMTGAPEGTLYDITIDVLQEDYLRMLIRAGLNSGAAIPPEAARMAEGTPESFFAEMDKIGLKLDPRKTMLDVVVVDKADRNPVEN